MNVTTELFQSLLLELIDENPFAVRSLLRILAVEFTDSVPTLAVTCEVEPVLKVNLGFLELHCHTDEHIKALMCHEFLHVLLRHTDETGPYNAARHLACDAVINAITHPQLGPAYSSMMGRYYASQLWPMKLLRPPVDVELRDYRTSSQTNLWKSLYLGYLVADDIASLAGDLASAKMPAKGSGKLLGNHTELGQGLPEKLADALDGALKEMNGGGIWRSPRERGVGADPYEALHKIDPPTRRDWRRAFARLLEQHLTPDRRSRQSAVVPTPYLLPVLSTTDRRAFVRSLWSPFLPEARWEGARSKPKGSAQLYLDVSGSMNAELSALAGLLGSLSKHIRRPFWAFSDEVAPAVIQEGALKTSTSGGTSLACVLRHLALTKPEAAVIVTDGYVEKVEPALVLKCQHTRLHVLVSAAGDTQAIQNAGLPWTKLKEVPR